MRDRRKCSECHHEFHPSCSKLYLSYCGANTCCFTKFSPMQSFRLRSSESSSSLTTLARTMSTSLSPAPQAASESTLNAFMEQQSQFNNNLTEMMRELKNEFKKIKNISKSVADHQVHIKKLEQQNAILDKNINELVQRQI